MTAYYDRELEVNVTKPFQDEGIPILKVQLLVISFKITQLVVLILSCSFFLGIFWIIICRDIFDWENTEDYDVYNQSNSFYSYYGFIDDLQKDRNFDAMTKLIYWALTTLSTIGYGDFLPKSVNEKIIVCIVMISGVSVFTYIIGKFITILNGYRELGV